MAGNFKLYNPETLFKTYMKPKDGLFAMMQPLIAQVSYLAEQNTKQPFEDIAENYIKAFIKTSPIAVAFLDLNYRFIAVSPKWFSWFKNHLHVQDKSLESLIGKNFFKLFNPCPKPIKRMLQASSGPKNHRSGLLKYDFKERKRWVKWESVPWYNAAHKPQGIMVFCEDVTKFHNMAIHNKKLQQCNQMLEDSVLIFFHDLIQPMRQIGNFIDLLKEHSKAQNKKDEFLEYAFSAIYESLQQVRNLSEGVILYCKKGELTVNPEAVSFYKVIEQIKNSCLVTSKANLKVLIKNDVYIHINKVSILQLFQNLLINAIKHAPDDPPVITLDGREVDNGFYQFILHNNGGCKSLHIKKHMLEPFQSSNLDGAGLGLAICKKIVTAYKGTIQIKSSVKKGTTVLVTLPLAP